MSISITFSPRERRSMSREKRTGCISARIVAPEDADVALVEVLKTTRRLVDPVHREVAGDCGRHA
jgi:hypothetical protein